MKYDRRTNYYCTPRNSSSSLSENQVFSPRIPLFPPRLSDRPHRRPRFDLSLSPRASFRRDVSQSKRFCNASMIYCTCRDLTSESFKRGATRTAILLPRSPLFRSHPTEPRKARRLIRGRADLPRNLYPPFHHPTSFIPLDLAGIRSSFNPFDFYTRWEGGG